MAEAGGRCIFDEVTAMAGSPLVLRSRGGVNGTEGVEHVRAGLAESEWGHLRIAVFTEDLKDPSRYCTATGQHRPTFTGETKECTSGDVLTQAKRDIVVNRLLPSAVQMHIDRLLVRRLIEPLVVPPLFGGVCSEFTVPDVHLWEGVPDADTVIYAAAGPMPPDVAAWATSCVTLADGRVVVGVTNLGAAFLSVSETSIRTIAHEVGHVLGFSFRSIYEAGMVTRVPGVRGKDGAALVSSPMTVQKTREHYNCSDAPGMELEDEGGTGTELSHWERRNAKDEMMSGISGPGRYTALTMAAFEDLGYYRGAWGEEEPMGWGHNAGCGLLTESCVSNGVAAYPDMFCSEAKDLLVCASGRDGLGGCDVVQHSDPLPPQYQYFPDPARGGIGYLLMDYCPHVVGYSNALCSSGVASRMRGSVIGPSSMCLKGDRLRDREGAIGDVCVDVLCANGSVSVRYLGSDAWQPCAEGDSIKPNVTFTDGVILCPAYDDVCIRAPVVELTSSTYHRLSVPQALLLVVVAMTHAVC